MIVYCSYFTRILYIFCPKYNFWDKAEPKKKDWSAAERVAAASDDQNSLQDILIGQASQAFINKEYQKAEAFLLRAEKPEIAVDLYREAGKLEDALRYSFILFNNWYIFLKYS